MAPSEISGVRRPGAEEYSYTIRRSDEAHPAARQDAVRAERMPANPKENRELEKVEPVDKEKAKAATEELNKQMDQLGTRVSFSTDEDSGRLIIKVVENETNKVVKQIPAEEMVRMFARMAELTGMLVDTRV